MGEFIIQIIIGLIIIIIGILNMKGNISLLHSYHRKRVKKEDIIPFGKKVGIKSNIVKFSDEDELEEALQNKIISKKDYNMAYKIGNKLLEEIKNKNNKYMNIDIMKYLNQYFK